jgi:hypothetical protein
MGADMVAARLIQSQINLCYGHSNLMEVNSMPGRVVIPPKKGKHPHYNISLEVENTR